MAAARRERTRKAAADVMRADAAVDVAMQQLVEAFEDRATALQQLKTEAGAGNVPNRLFDPHIPLRAAKYFGLGKHIAMEHVSPIHFRSLTDADRALLADLGADPVSQDESQRPAAVAG
jgi:hypothetical protein